MALPSVSSNGVAPASPGSPLESMRSRPANVHLFRGYGPLVVGAILFVLMVLLAPTVAPEHVVEQPVGSSTTTVATTTTAAP